MSEDDHTDVSLERDPDQLYLNTDVWGSLFISIFGLIGWFGADDGSFNVWVFPKTASAVILILAAIMIVKGLIRPKVEPVISKSNGIRLVLPMALGLVLFFVLVTRLGWILTTTLLFGSAMFLLQPKKNLKSAAVSYLMAGGLAVFFYYVFGNVFYVPWPEGSWLEPLLGG